MRHKTKTPTEGEIVKAVCEGRREGQTEMVCRYADRVFAMIVRQVGNEMDARELTQDTFLRAFSHIGSYDARKASLSTWLCRIGYHLTLDFQKRRRRQMMFLAETEELLDDVSDEMLETGLSTGKEENIRRLERLIDDLTDDERMLVTLYYYDDLPLAEIAYIMGIEAKPLAKRLYRIRKKLYKKLKEDAREI
ncbi:MAG: RNA polymerase sigma factor [Prevotella sp.]|nr:RNA polymerase sigma factor [Prevotella sp.]